MPAGPIPGFREAWRLAANAGSSAQAFYMRAQLITLSINVLAMVLLPTALLAALFLRSRAAGAVGIIVLAAEVANLAAGRVLVIWLAFQQGFWIGWRKQPVRLQDQPAQFYRWTAAHAVLPLIWVSVAVFLLVSTAQLLLPFGR